MFEKQAVILAGGKGTRLKPYTTLFPKALVPLNEMPVLELIIRQLSQQGFKNITLSVGHLAELIEAYFGDGKKWDVQIRYVREDMPLGTAGSLSIIEQLPENFLVMNSDIVSDISYARFFEKHLQFVNELTHLATIATYQRTSRIDFGVIEVNEALGTIARFIEKPEFNHTVSMGVYAFNRRILQYIPQHQYFGFDQLMQQLIDAQQPVKTFNFNGYWLDIGRLDDYETAVNDFNQLREVLLPSAVPAAPLSPL
jgi:NDP-mannose synthase